MGLEKTRLLVESQPSHPRQNARGDILLISWFRLETDFDIIFPGHLRGYIDEKCAFLALDIQTEPILTDVEISWLSGRQH